MERSELLENLTEDIASYVMHGEFPEDELAAELKHDELDERFRDYGLLMDLHFILKPEVVNFVEELPQRIRSIKTQTKNKSKTQRGSVNGKINWSSTIQKRYAENPGDRSLFVTEKRTEHYDIDENIVLKKLLLVIYYTLQEAREYIEEDYTWVNERWRKNRDLIEEMERIFEKDVHVKRIRNPEEYEPTDRMLNNAENSRQRIYQRSAELLEDRKKIFEGDEDAIKEMLQETAITPDDEETLLELFVLFRFISTIEDMEDEGFSLNTIESGSQKVASLASDEKEIAVYHDSSTDIQNISFKFDPENDVDGREYSRPEKVEIKSNRIIEDYFDKDTVSTTGRPDVILVEVVDKQGGEREYFITEVKNSTNEKTIRRGIKETLEYLAFLRDENGFIYDKENLGGEKSGLLVVQDFEDGDKGTDLRDQDRSISIIEASKLEDNIEELINKKISV
ncbi:MAG: hypothetical protein J07AB43_09790 [Candidatus Nanosalina sp. J07AB43]|nr:MAG: hypothetical protein J07AB43_09790 [Candidatus Nanosalina sp. J07AB43]